MQVGEPLLCNSPTLIHIIFNCINFYIARIKQDFDIPIPEYQMCGIYTLDITKTSSPTLISSDKSH